MQNILAFKNIRQESETVSGLAASIDGAVTPFGGNGGHAARCTQSRPVSEDDRKVGIEEYHQYATSSKRRT